MALESIGTVQEKLGRNDPERMKPETRWRTPTQQRIYGQRLLQALKSTRRSSSQPLAPSRAIKEAADSALALTAKGQTRWSRAILSRRWRRRKLLLKSGGKIRRFSPTPTRVGKPGSGSGSAKDRLPMEEEEKVEDRLRVLSRLVPGGRKLSTPTLLEETADYVAALEVQVKAMCMLVDRLSSTPPSSEFWRGELTRFRDGGVFLNYVGFTVNSLTCMYMLCFYFFIFAILISPLFISPPRLQPTKLAFS